MNKNYRIQEITTLDLPELQPYRTLRRSTEHVRDRIFVAEGEKVVRRLLASNLSIISMLMTKQWFEKIFPNDYNISNPIIFISEKSNIESIVGYHLHQGIMAVAKIPTEIQLDKLLEKNTPSLLFVALDNLVNSENVGIIVRNCAAFGVNAIIVGETSSSPYLRRAVRNSMGTVFKLPIIHSKNLAETLSELKTKYNVQIIGAHPHEKQSLYTSNFSEKICIVFGNEDEGISENILDICDDYIAIPMMNDVDSLNVACSSAVFLYEIRKQIDKNKFADPITGIGK